MSHIVYDDLTGMDSVTLMGKVSDICKDLDKLQKDALLARFDKAILLSEKQACYAVAALNQWHHLAAHFTTIIAGAQAGKGVIYA